MAATKHITLLVSLFVLTLSAQSQVDRFKAAYIYSIATHGEWPAIEDQSKFIIGVLGETNVKFELDLLAQRKKIFGKTILVHEFVSLSQLTYCHLLFVNSDYVRYFPQILAKISTTPTLIFADKRGAIEKGAAINFVMEGDKLRFEYKKAHAARQGITLSKTIEKLAHKNL